MTFHQNLVFAVCYPFFLLFSPRDVVHQFVGFSFAHFSYTRTHVGSHVRDFFDSVPNFILAFIPAHINRNTLNTMTAFAVRVCA